MTDGSARRTLLPRWQANRRLGSRHNHRVPGSPALDLASVGIVIDLRLVHVERLEGDAVWLRYEVTRQQETKHG